MSTVSWFLIALLSPTAASPPDNGERTRTAGNVTLHYAPESEALSADLLMCAVKSNEYLARLFRPAEPVRQQVFWLPARQWRWEPKTYGFPYASGADAYLAAADVDVPTQLASIADAMEIERGGPDVTRMAELLGMPKEAWPEDVFRRLKGSKEFFVAYTAGFILPHELTHGFCNVLGYPAKPRWFYEGIAQHVAFHVQRELRSPREAELSYAYYQLLWDRAIPRLEVKEFLRADELGAGGLTTANYAWYHAGLLRMFRDLEAMKGANLLPDLVREASKLRGRREVSNADMIGVFSAAVGRDLKSWFSENWRIDAGDRGETLYNGIRLPAIWPPRLSSFPTSVEQDPATPPYLTSPPEVIPVDVGRQLFVDDFLIAETTLKRTFHLAKYHPASPVLRPDKAWELDRDPRRGNSVAMVFSDGVWYDPRDKLFKIWYMSGSTEATAYASSEDGIHWEKPVLDVKPGTNIVVSGYRDSNTVWLDLEEKDPGRRYKMFRVVGADGPDPVTEWNNWVMSIHFSGDGIHWSHAGMSGRLVDRSTVFWNPFRKIWVYSIRHMYPWSRATYGAARRRSYVENADVFEGSRWQVGEPLPWTDVDRLDPMREDLKIKPQLYNLDAVAYESLMLGFFTIWRGQPADRQKPNDVVLGYSRDGWHWHRPDRRAFCPVSDKQGDWNANNVQSAGGGCLVVGDQLYFYVSGRAGVPGSNGAGACTTGLATLRRDGFASMDAADDGGTLTTRPVRFSGRRLFVNVEAPAGELRAEVLEEGGRVLEPYSRRACVPIRADRTLQEVRWEGVEDLAALAGITVRFRFHLRNGRLYAFWVSPDASGASRGYVAAGGPGFTGPTDTVGVEALR